MASQNWLKDVKADLWDGKGKWMLAVLVLFSVCGVWIVEPLLTIFFLSSYIWMPSGWIVVVGACLAVALLVYSVRGLLRARRNNLERRRDDLPMMWLPIAIIMANWVIAMSLALAVAMAFSLHRLHPGNDEAMRIAIQWVRHEVWPFLK